MKHRLRDPTSGLTPFIGVIPAVIGLVILLTRTARPFTAWHAAGFSIFGGAMVMLYPCSTLYHWLPLVGRRREVLRRLDHIRLSRNLLRFRDAGSMSHFWMTYRYIRGRAAVRQ